MILELIVLGVRIAGACGNHHHHHKRTTHLSCELAEARGALGRRSDDDRTWRPSYLVHRAEAIFAHVEEARHEHATRCLLGYASPGGMDVVARDFRHGRCEPRDLEHVSIAACVDRPGDCDDAAYVLLELFEHDCHEHQMELWRLVRGEHHRDWVIDDVFRGAAIATEVRAAKRAAGLAHAGRSDGRGGHGGDGAVRKLG